jgi:hypothetical protein
MKLAVLAFVTTLGLGGVVAADPAPMAPTHPRGQFKQLLLERFDRNHDGQLDRQERRHAIRALRRLAYRMAMQERRAEGRPGARDPRGIRDPQGTDRTARDADRAARREARRRALIQRYDRNGDGVVGPDEMPPGMARRLRPLDRNRDGGLDDRDDR